MYDLIEALAWYTVFLFSTTLHEAAHAWAAKRGGDLTAYYGGQVSLDPLPHMRREPLGMLMLPLLSAVAFGWPLGFASTPYDPDWARRCPRRAAWMALAGPVANLLLVVMAALCIRLGMYLGQLESPEFVWFAQVTVGTDSGYWSGAAVLLSMLFTLNLLLLVFNLLPLPPLDGSGILALFLSKESAIWYQNFITQPMLGWMGMMVAWNVFGPLFRPIFLLAITLLYPEASYG